MRKAVKLIVMTVCLLAVFPSAAIAGFGRFKSLYSMFAHCYALAPGILGDYLRIAFYKWTLTECDLSSRIQFGSFFAHPEAKIADRVYIGSYCIFGRVAIGEATQIASGVQILSGGHQHVRDEFGRISGAEDGVFTTVTVGANCWIGAAAIVMADVGAGSTVGAGSVVSRRIPSGVVAVGSPAKVIGSAMEPTRPAISTPVSAA